MRLRLPLSASTPARPSADIPAFAGMGLVMRSVRHDSGFALRFPRIVRVREDKLPEEIDTVEEVERIYKLQHGR